MEVTVPVFYINYGSTVVWELKGLVRVQINCDKGLEMHLDEIHHMPSHPTCETIPVLHIHGEKEEAHSEDY